MPTAAQYAARRTSGRCTRCRQVRPPDWDKLLCPECQKAQAKSNRRWRERNQDRVQQYDARSNAKRRDRARALRLCIACGDPCAKGILRCRGCSTRDNGRAKDRRAAIERAIGDLIWLIAGER